MWGTSAVPAEQGKILCPDNALVVPVVIMSENQNDVCQPSVHKLYYYN